MPVRRSVRDASRFLFSSAGRGSAAEPDLGGTQIRPANGTRRRDQRTDEESVDALGGARAVIRGVQPVRGGSAGQLVTGDNEGGEALQGVDSAGDRDVDGDRDRDGAGSRGSERLRAGLPGGRSGVVAIGGAGDVRHAGPGLVVDPAEHASSVRDRKSTRLNSSHLVISYAVFC